MAHVLDPVALTQALIRRPSVTPKDEGAIEVVADAARAIGFTCTRLDFGAPDRPVIANLFAKIGDGAPHFCFAGHTDVVPPGPLSDWGCDPFAGALRDGLVIGRGAADMKGAIACFLSAAQAFVAHTKGGKFGTISLLITGDEEGKAIDGTVKVLEWMAANDEIPDYCLVGEPTSDAAVGDTIKIGRRGSMTGRLTIKGRQGHVAYPHLADNAVPKLMNVLQRLTARRFNDRTARFDPSNLEVVQVEAFAGATNVIPGEARAAFNIRFNPTHTGAELAEWAQAEVAAAMQGQTAEARLDINISGEPFLTEPGLFSDVVARAVQTAAGVKPVLSTTGGTSDARFISRFCPVVELGLCNATMHQANEAVPVDDLKSLTRIYEAVLAGFFEDMDGDP